MGGEPVREVVRLVAGEPAKLPADHELIERMAVGDNDALGLLFDRHHRALYGFLHRIGGTNEADLDDLVQATFLEAHRSAARFRGGASARTWLFAIGANVARTSRRASMRRQRALDRMAWQPKRASTSPEQRLGETLALSRVAAAIEALPYDLRVSYVMCVIEEVSAEDVAAALRVPRGTVWRRVHQARVELRRALEQGAEP
jgi:RNA polymerase sigma factor (sigma-70 family)